MAGLASPRLSDGEADAKAFESVYAVEESGARAEDEPEAEEPLSLMIRGQSTDQSAGLSAEGGMLWSLISPCSDAGEDGPAFFPDDERDEHSGDCAVERGDERERGQTPPADDSDGDEEAEDAQDSGSDEEVEVFHAESFWAAVERPPPGELAWWPDSDKEEEEDSDNRGHESDDALGDAIDTGDAAGATSDAAVVMPLWTRLKARSYAGATSSGVHAAVASMKQRARTISSMATSSARHLEEEDDGDFSSDDEDCRRKSDLHDLARGSGSGLRQRRQSFAFAARLSVAAPSIDSLRSARGKFGHKLHLFRSSSSNTVTSEESFLDSPSGGSFGGAMAGEVKSAPASMHLGAGYSAAGKLGSRGSSSSSSLHVPKHLHAGVSRAADFLTAASAEAARKLKAKTTALRAQRKPETSETEEEEPEAAASTSVSVSTAVISTVVAGDGRVGA